VPTSNTFRIPNPIPAHRGFEVIHHEEMETSDGVAFRTTVAHGGQDAVHAENSGRGGPTDLDYAGGTLHADFRALADGTLMDDEGAAPLENEEDVLELLTATYENEKRSVKNTLIRGPLPPQSPDTLALRETYVVKGRLTPERARQAALSSTPPCTQWYVPGEGWVDLDTP